MCCEDCLLEKWRHNQTKRALNRAIGLAHRLMQECRRLEGRISELEIAKKDDGGTKVTDTAAAWFNLSNHIGLELSNRAGDPKKPVVIDAWAQNNNRESLDVKL